MKTIDPPSNIQSSTFKIRRKRMSASDNLTFRRFPLIPMVTEQLAIYI